MPGTTVPKTMTIYDADRVDARNEILAALQRPYRIAPGRLHLSNLRRPGTVAALLDMLTDVTYDEWVGLESGYDYCTWTGQLPSGVPVDITVELHEWTAVSP